jgi:regulator of CtrA degradation
MMKQDINFIEISLKKAYQLLEETHHYIKWQAPLDIQRMSKDNILKMSCEAMRITVRITQIMAWLTLQKSILAGESTPEDVHSRNAPILQGKTCLEIASETDLLLPERLRELLKKSRLFYIQTMQLEESSLRNRPLPEEIKKEGNTRPYLCRKKRSRSAE